MRELQDSITYGTAFAHSEFLYHNSDSNRMFCLNAEILIFAELKKLNSIILNRFIALLIGGNILFSGSSLFIISIALHSDAECCCINTLSGHDESFECGKDCCAITDAKFQNFVGNIHSTFQFKENSHCQFLIFDFTGQNFSSKYTLYENPAEKIIHKVYIVKSEFRI